MCAYNIALCIHMYMYMWCVGMCIYREKEILIFQAIHTNFTNFYPTKNK